MSISTKTTLYSYFGVCSLLSSPYSRILGTSSPNYPCRTPRVSLIYLRLYDHLTKGIVCCCFSLIPTVTTCESAMPDGPGFGDRRLEGNEPTRWQGTEQSTYIQ